MMARAFMVAALLALASAPVARAQLPADSVIPMNTKGKYAQVVRFFVVAVPRAGRAPPRRRRRRFLKNREHPPRAAPLSSRRQKDPAPLLYAGRAGSVLARRAGGARSERPWPLCADAAAAAAAARELSAPRRGGWPPPPPPAAERSLPPRLFAPAWRLTRSRLGPASARPAGAADGPPICVNVQARAHAAAFFGPGSLARAPPTAGPKRGGGGAATRTGKNRGGGALAAAKPLGRAPGTPSRCFRPLSLSLSRPNDDRSPTPSCVPPSPPPK